MEMAKKNKNKSKDKVELFTGTMKDNEEFLQHNTKESYGEVIDLINDAIDWMKYMVEKENAKETYIKSPMAFFSYHNFMPTSYAIYADLMIGNIPACFMELRLMLEMFAKSYYADLKYPERSFFQEKFELVEEENASISKILKEIGKYLGVGDSFVALWGKLSKDWLHSKGVVDRVVSQVTEKSDIPSWALVIPVKYTEYDLETIEELKKRIREFRNLLRSVNL